MATKREIAIEGGGTLRLVLAEAGDPADRLAAALAIGDVQAVVVLAGDERAADDRLKQRLAQLMGRGLVRAAREAGALCLVWGGSAGLGRLVGEAVADAAKPPPLLGLAPASQLRLPGQPGDGDELRQPPAPGLSHLLLTPDESLAKRLRGQCDLAQTLAAGKPVMMVLIGGTAATLAEVLQAVRRRWPVLVVQGSGGAADALASRWGQDPADPGAAHSADDPVSAEILADGQLICVTLGEQVGEAVQTLARQLLRLSGGDSVLRQAWQRFAAIDAAAVRQQREFDLGQQWILALGLLAVVLAIAQSGLQLEEPANQTGPGEWLYQSLRVVLIIVPISISALIAASNRFKPGKRWVLLRAAAEGIKREIYRCRLMAGLDGADDTRDKMLSQAIEDITRRLARTEANTTALPAYGGELPPRYAASAQDDGLSAIGADQYVQLRLVDQLAFFRRKTVSLERQSRSLQIAVLVAGAVGSLLAALGGAAVIWIALSSAVVGAVMSYLSYRQVETTLVNYNQTAADLDNLLCWWTALTPGEQMQRAHIEALVNHTEDVLASELAGWTQRMTDALGKLRGQTGQPDKDAEASPEAVSADAPAAAEPRP
jgi:hypothetical protein